MLILIVSFFIYCFMGWIWESIILPIARGQTPYNRGFLNGPWIPIYGFGAILVILLFGVKGVTYPIHILFICGGVAACVLEYLTSYMMEKIFHRRWWDYSHKAFNLNGRICGEGFLCFALFSVIAVKYFQPFLTQLLQRVSCNILEIIAFILVVFFVIDILISTRIALQVEEKIDALKWILEQEEERIIARFNGKENKLYQRALARGLEHQKQQLMLKRFLQDKKVYKYGQRRLLNAFPHVLKKRTKTGVKDEE